MPSAATGWTSATTAGGLPSPPGPPPRSPRRRNPCSCSLRSGNRPSQDAGRRIPNRRSALIRPAVRKILLRGDTRDRREQAWMRGTSALRGTARRSPMPGDLIPGRRGEHPLPLRISAYRTSSAKPTSCRRGVRFPGTTCALRDQDLAPSAARTGQAGDHPGTRVQTIHLLER